MGQRISINRPGDNKYGLPISNVSYQITANTLSGLSDVDPSDIDDGEVPVWNEVTGKYEIRTLKILDGGSF